MYIDDGLGRVGEVSGSDGCNWEHQLILGQNDLTKLKCTKERTDLVTVSRDLLSFWMEFLDGVLGVSGGFTD